MAAGGFLIYRQLSKKSEPPETEPSKMVNSKMIKLSSPAFLAGQAIPKKYTCDGQNINPSLAIENVPSQAKSLALIVDDPDAPGGTFNHWLVFNIEPSTIEIQENNSPQDGILGTNDFGKIGYGGPCPPSGQHRYFFRLFALDTKLDIAQGVKRGELENAMQNHILDKTELFGTYSRQ